MNSNIKTLDNSLIPESNMTVIDLETWERTEHFNFFQASRSCQFGLTVQVDVTNLYNFRKQANKSGRGLRLSDILYYFATKTANAIPEFRTRIVDGKPVIFDVVHPAFTYIPNGRKLHANVLAGYAEDYSTQSKNFDSARMQSDRNPTLTPKGGDKQNLLYFSIVSGVHFSSASNPWGDCNTDTVPRVLFGQISNSDSGRKILPVSLEMLHSLADGQHTAEFFKKFTEMCENPEKFIE
ncbi:CatA-like O-acetyltransferase [Maridesulfovibrio zosterae]|uniref:CatA-like O-acetyltransferase n=1 Tax=Maridesulfovibrio zosterae TaxID=82171 RepID=UPI000413BFB4|nr:CatA-like O-acetyltransferase [Maridesulfovibrio zosterae]